MDDFESYETALDYNEVYEVTTVVAGTYRFILNGTPFSYPASGAESTAALAGLLRDQITNSSHPYTATVINSNQITIRIDAPGFSLLVSTEVPTGGVLTRLTETLRLTNWLSPLLGV